MRVDIVIVSYKPDLPWLAYCLRLLQKNWLDYSRVIVRLPEDCAAAIKDWRFLNTEFYYVNPWPDGYMFQMYQKLVSDDYSDAELILCVDSDVMLMRPARLSDFMVNRRPLIHYRNWGEKGEEVAEKVWRRPTSIVMGMDLDKDYMVAAPPLFWRDTFAVTRQHIVRVTGRGFFESVYSDVAFNAEGFTTHPMTFCDFEALSLCGAKLEADRYEVRHDDNRSASWPFKQFWSHGGLTLAIEKELKLALDSKD